MLGRQIFCPLPSDEAIARCWPQGLCGTMIACTRQSTSATFSFVAQMAGKMQRHGIDPSLQCALRQTCYSLGGGRLDRMLSHTVQVQPSVPSCCSEVKLTTDHKGVATHACTPVPLAARPVRPLLKSVAWLGSGPLVAAVVVQCNNVAVGWGLRQGGKEGVGIVVVTIGDDHPLCGVGAGADGFICEIV